MVLGIVLSRKLVGQTPPAVLFVCRRLKESGFQAYVVGGSLRDLLLGRKPKDWDVSTDATPDQITGIFTEVIPTGERYGTVTVRLDSEGDLDPSGGFGLRQVEVTTFRVEEEYADGRHPSGVHFVRRVEDDLARRDFTINAMAFDPLEGKLIDPFRGRRDLRRRLVRSVGQADERFREDGLRMLRCFRFASQLAFRIERRTLLAVDSSLISGVSWERIGQEMARLLLGKSPHPALRGLADTGLIAKIAPELERCRGVEGGRGPWDLLEHSFRAVSMVPPSLHLRAAALLHDIGKPLTRKLEDGRLTFHGHDHKGAELAEEVLGRWRWDGKTKRRAQLLIEHHMFQVHAASTDRALRRWIAKVGEDNALDLLELRRADIVASGGLAALAWPHWSSLKRRVEGILASQNALTVGDLALSGHDVMQILGVRPGPIVGEALDYLLEHVLGDPRLNDPERLRGLLKEWGRKKGIL